jgi:hypothetical protein
MAVRADPKERILFSNNQEVNDSNHFICGVAERTLQQISAQARDRNASWMSARFS